MGTRVLWLGILLSLTASAQVQTLPLKGKIDAVIVIDKGGDKKNLPELDGSALVLGDSRCAVKNGRCVLENVTAGSHIPGAFLTSNVEKVNYKLLENIDALVQVKAEPTGMVIMPKKSRELVFHVERFEDDEYAPPKPDPSPTTIAGVKLDSSLTVNIWVRVIHPGEGGGHFDREAEGDELKGTILKLGAFTCVVKKNICVFPKIEAGEYKLAGKLIGSSDATYALAPSKPFVVIVDPWTHRPKIKGWDKLPIITIEKTIRNQPKDPSAR